MRAAVQLTAAYPSETYSSTSANGIQEGLPVGERPPVRHPVTGRSVPEPHEQRPQHGHECQEGAAQAQHPIGCETCRSLTRHRGPGEQAGQEEERADHEERRRAEQGGEHQL
jgi:hypothetical protein